MAVAESHVLTDIRNGIGWITLNRPRALNALSFEMVTTLDPKRIIEEIIHSLKRSASQGNA